MKVNTSTTYSSKSNEVTLDSMILSLKKLEVEMKVEDIKANGAKVIAFFPRHFRRPKWIVELLAKNNIQSMRSRFIEDKRFYLLDTNKFHFWDNKVSPTQSQDKGGTE